VNEIMTDDGWTLNDQGMWEKDGSPLLCVYYNIGGYGLSELAEMVQGQMLRAGFDVEIRTVALGAWLAAVGEGQHNIAPTMGDATDPTILRSMYSETMMDSMLNRSKIVGNTELESLLLEQDSESDVDAREKLLLRIQEIIMDQAYTVPLFDVVETYAAIGAIQDLTFDPATHPLLYDAWIQP
jgi:peptide/nickel transport system substrate-binding protein